MNRRLFIRNAATLAAGLPLAASLAPFSSAYALGEVTEQDHILGDKNAPVTLIEYASLTCSHCANFHKDVLPQIKTNWLETGRARLVYRHMPLDGVAFIGALAAECFEGDRYFTFLDFLFKQQQVWAFGGDPKGELTKIASLAGVSKEQLEKCLADEELQKRVVTQAQEGKRLGVNSTPSFILNEELYPGGRDYDAMNELLEDAS
ncbi:DsbA family protein [Kiloniella laminariae]|uniref:DsbA family protein n=1 Tax=Kiloniella laminariae TaxID=454162 RepID=UPI00037BF6C7|nr:thioredoxin domain-containing protein [Kiloniella laminariae]